MKKRKRILAILLSLVITITYVPALAFAGTEDGDTWIDQPAGN